MPCRLTFQDPKLQLYACRILCREELCGELDLGKVIVVKGSSAQKDVRISSYGRNDC